MECEEVRRSLVEHLTGGLDRTGRDALDRHLDSCGACKAEARALRELWDELGTLPNPVPDARVLTRIERRVVAAAPVPDRADGSSVWSTLTGLGGSRSRRHPAVLTAAAALVVGLLGGALATLSLAPSATGPTGVPGAAAADATPRFLLLLEPPAGGWDRDEGEDVRASRVREYADWANRLDRSGHLVMAEKLADATAGRQVARDGTTGPIDAGEATATIGGFFLIRAPSLERAIEIARGSPHLSHGGTIVVRRVEVTP